MKRVILITTAFVTLALSAINAQEGAQFSLLVGPNCAWADGNKSYYTSTPEVGFSLGGSIQTILQNRFGFEFQMVYSYNQAKYRFHQTEPYYDYSETLSGSQRITFIDMPIMITYSVAKGFFDKFKIGFVPSWALSAHTSNKYRQEDNYSSYEDHFSGNNDYIFKSSDIALTAGSELHLSHGLGLDIRYAYGLRNLFDPNGNGGDFLKIKRSVISVLLKNTF